MADKNSFIFYLSYFEYTKDLNDSDFGRLIRAMGQYEITREPPQLDGILQMAFNFIRGDLDRNRNKYQSIVDRNRANGAKGGRPPKPENPAEPKKPSGLSGNPKKPKKPDDVDDDDDGEENILSGKPDLAPQEDEETATNIDQIRSVIEYLNQKTGKEYRVSTKATQRHINARFAEGFTVEDCKRVIDDRCKAWNHPPAPGKEDMRLYLRPETLFSTKFEGYLNNLPQGQWNAERDPNTGIQYAN